MTHERRPRHGLVRRTRRRLTSPDSLRTRGSDAAGRRLKPRSAAQTKPSNRWRLSSRYFSAGRDHLHKCLPRRLASQLSRDLTRSGGQHSLQLQREPECSRWIHERRCAWPTATRHLSGRPTALSRERCERRFSTLPVICLDGFRVPRATPGAVTESWKSSLPIQLGEPAGGEMKPPRGIAWGEKKPTHANGLLTVA